MTAEFMAVPQNLEAEQSVIGGLLLDDDNSERVQKVLAMLKPESFYSRPHQLIFAEMRQMFRDNKPVDGLTLFDALEGKGLAEQVGGFAYLAEIAKNTPSAANIVAYAASVREAAMERYGINRLTQLNRELEKRVNKRPLPSDSRDTGQIEQDCDYWVGIHREGAFDDSVPPGETELILRLNRHGSTGTVYCHQINGAIYDTDQQAAAAERRGREQQPKKKGGF